MFEYHYTRLIVGTPIGRRSLVHMAWGHGYIVVFFDADLPPLLCGGMGVFSIYRAHPPARALMVEMDRG